MKPRLIVKVPPREVVVGPKMPSKDGMPIPKLREDETVLVRQLNFAVLRAKREYERSISRLQDAVDGIDERTGFSRMGLVLDTSTAKIIMRPQ